MTLMANDSADTKVKQQPSGGVAKIFDNLYLASFASTPKDDDQFAFFDVDEYVHYDAFYDDFGPLNLAVLYRFCESLHAVLESDARKQKAIYVVASNCPKSRVNSAYLVAAYMIIYHQFSADQAYKRVQAIEPPKLIKFRDAAMGQPSYLLHVHDVIKSIEKAVEFKWLNFFNKSFDPDEYEFYERVENGDFNWIIPGKILSFCGPHDRSYNENGYPYHAPEVYFEYFRKTNVASVVRLNRKVYDANRFVEAGFAHHDLFFIDGSTPSDEIVLKFIDVVDKAPGAVAVHCKAGLGRTGTLIACWMMKNFKLTAAQCMGWLRICRPGSVIGPQQQFLIDKQAWCWNLANLQTSPLAVPRKSLNKASSVKSKILLTRLANELDDFGLCDMKNGVATPPLSPATSSTDKLSLPTVPVRAYSLRTRQISTGDIVDSNGNTAEVETFDETAINERGQSQGDRLCEMKAKVQHGKDQGGAFTRPSALPSVSMTARSSSKYSSATTPIKQLKLSSSRAPDLLFPGPRLQNFATRPAVGYRNANAFSRTPVTVASSSYRPSILRNNPSKKYFGIRNSKPYSSSLGRSETNKLLEGSHVPGSSPSDGVNNNSSFGNRNGGFGGSFGCGRKYEYKYELRPRSNLHLPSRFDPATTLSPSSSAFIPAVGNRVMSSPSVSTRL